MTIADLIKDAKRIANYFTNWEIPMDQDVHFELERNRGQHVIKVIVEKK